MPEKKFIEKLRETTGPMHQKLEQTLTSRQVVNPDLSLADYENYLRKIYNLHSEIEEKIFPLLEKQVENIEQREKVAAISKDLENVGSPEPIQKVSFTNENFIADPAFCMGIMYVSEGSTLGGLHIVKNVSASLGESVKGATNFLTVYGEQTGSKWKQFMQELDQFQLSVDDVTRQRIIDGAVYGFERTYEIFNN